MISTDLRVRLHASTANERCVLWLDVSLSLSYHPSTGYTGALLHGCTHRQRSALRRQLCACSSLGSHPLLIPVLLISMKQQIIGDQAQGLWRDLMTVETESGLTGAPVIGARSFQASSLTDQDIESVTRRALGIVQIAAAAGAHAKALLVLIQSIQESLKEVDRATIPTNKEHIQKAGRILLERLKSLAQTTQVKIPRANNTSDPR